MRELSESELRWERESARWTEEMLEAAEKARQLEGWFTHARAAELAADVSYVTDKIRACAGHPLSDLFWEARFAAEELAAAGTPSRADLRELAEFLAYLADECGAAHDVLARRRAAADRENARPPSETLSSSFQNLSI